MRGDSRPPLPEARGPIFRRRRRRPTDDLGLGGKLRRPFVVPPGPQGIGGDRVHGKLVHEKHDIGSSGPQGDPKQKLHR